MPNLKALATLYITLVAALATAQTLNIAAHIQPYGAPPYSPHVNGTTFNLYEWVVINGTVTPRETFYGDIIVTIIDNYSREAVASCKAQNIHLQPRETYKLYEILRNRCELTVSSSYKLADLVRVRQTDNLALNFTGAPVVGVNRYTINVTFVSGKSHASFSANFSISNTMKITVKAFGIRTLTWGETYPHNKGYDFRLVVDVSHPDGRPYTNTSITVYVNDQRKVVRYWANRTHQSEYVLSAGSSATLIVPCSKLQPDFYRVMVNVSNVRLSLNRNNNIVNYNVTGVNNAQFNFTLHVTNELQVKFINVTAVWPNYDSTPPSLRGTPTGINYTKHEDFNKSMWTIGDAFVLYAMVELANGTGLSMISTEFERSPTGVEGRHRTEGNIVIVTVNATMKESEWRDGYRARHSGVKVNATLKVRDDKNNEGKLGLQFFVTNKTLHLDRSIFFNASKAEVTNGSKVNLGDVLALNLTVITHGGRRLNFTKGFDIKVYNVASSDQRDYTDLFSIRRRNATIYLVVKPSRDAWKITKDNWRTFMNATYLIVEIKERGMPGRMNLTLWWPGYRGGGYYERFNINVTARLPEARISFNNGTVVDYVNYGQRVMLTIIFKTHGGNETRAYGLSLYVYRIDNEMRPFGRVNVTKSLRGDPDRRDGNYTYIFNIDGKHPWIPGDWYVNVTVSDIFGNFGDVGNNTRLFTIRPKIVHSLPKSLRVMAGKTASISSSLTWGNGSSITSDAKLNITILYPTVDGLSNTTMTLGHISDRFAASIQAPNRPGSYRVVVNFTYMTFGKKLIETWEINMTVHVSVNATISDMRSNPKLVAVAFGRSVPRGPVKGALVEDNLAAAALAAVIGTNNLFFDEELLDPNTLDYRTVAGSYRYVVAVGGPIVNLFSYKYNRTLSSIVQTYKKVVADEVVEVGFEIKVPGDITRVYLNLTDNKYYIVYANGTVKVAGDYGKADFAFVATLYDASVGKYIFISFGLDWRGTVAAGRWIATNIDKLDELARGQLVLLQWTDKNNDGRIEAGEVDLISGA